MEATSTMVIVTASILFKVIFMKTTHRIKAKICNQYYFSTIKCFMSYLVFLIDNACIIYHVCLCLNIVCTLPYVCCFMCMMSFYHMHCLLTVCGLSIVSLYYNGGNQYHGNSDCVYFIQSYIYENNTSYKSKNM
jgi:hypothetical protein